MKHQTKQCGGLIAHFVGDSITCVRDTKTGKFVTKATWKKATEKQALAKAYAVVALQPVNKNKGYNTVNRGNSAHFFSVVSLLLFVTSIFKTHYKANKQAYYDAKIAVILMLSALPAIFVVGQAYKLLTSLFCA